MMHFSEWIKNSNGYITNIEHETLNNNNYRKVIYTAKHSQLVLMSIKPKEEIGEEIHNADQFIRIESGQGKIILNKKTQQIKEGFAIVVPAGTKHNIINTGTTPLKLYTVYSPPQHKDNTINKNKND